MALENRSIQDINDLIINQLESQLNKTFPLLPKSFIRVLSKTLAGIFIILYKTAGWIFLQIFVSTASYTDINILGKIINPLKEWGRLVGVGDPIPAVQTELELSIAVNDIGSILYAGTQFTSTLNGILYITQENYTLSTDPYTIEVIAVTGGEIGNLDDGDTLSSINTLGIIDNITTISDTLVTGVDLEDEANYRRRIIERFQQQPQGGAYSDYRIWASDVAGVQQTYIYSGDPPSNVLVYVAGDPDIYVDRVADSALLLAVADAILYDPDTGMATRKPVTAIIDPDGDESYANIVSISNVTFDVEITSLVCEIDINDTIYEALVEYFGSSEPFIEGLSIPPNRGTVTQANVVGIVNDIVKANSGTFLTAILSISGVISTNYSLLEGELAKLGTLTINGVGYTP